MVLETAWVKELDDFIDQLEIERKQKKIHKELASDFENFGNEELVEKVPSKKICQTLIKTFDVFVARKGWILRIDLLKVGKAYFI
ncbi:8204_t:CDS:2 [Acaulospora morrowiae]|uniref:8204_t:CDS:1 n=1 Tax=Acaulospora morrowiae TaxID=94023 RepID=A0A9N9GAV0_9GLOM|nr:8204_t:CDS:2 [Acaulospora morrowiae]